MIRFAASVAGVETLNRAFNRVEEQITDFRNFWPGVIQAFYEIETAQFATEGAQGASGKWTPLSPAYKLFKERQFPGQPILQREHELYNSLTDPDAIGAIIRPEQDQLTLGSAVPYALMHQRGGGRLPARPPISLSEANKRQFTKSIQRRLVEYARKTGFEVREEAA